MLEPFGPNVVSTNGDAVHRTVWAETLQQTQTLAKRWAAHSGGGSLRDGVYNLTVNVMSEAGFGQSCQNGTESLVSPPPGHSLSLVQSLFEVVTNLPIFVLLPAWLIRICAQKVYTAYNELELYMNELLDQGNAAMDGRNEIKSTKTKGNLLTALLEANSQQPVETRDLVTGPGGRTQLTDVEVKGNVSHLPVGRFVIAIHDPIQRYDTTANTIIFSSIVLTLYDSIQDSVIAEIRQVYREAAEAGRSELSYDEDLPKFRYLLAFKVRWTKIALENEASAQLILIHAPQYEVMRVFPIVIPITRLAVTDQDLVVNSSKHILSAQTLTIVDNTAIHHNEANWPHPHIIEPRRWLTSSLNTFDPTTSLNHEQEADLFNPSATPIRPMASHRRGTFMTFK
ncbi:uncharacterized protein N7483_000463 [Penicillium malachiteum]|uniref:uncharacterized protein n=1 Tax=Penicillium malachiteum TaxID=1324776 RepID=UPI002546D97E|nr:uncharacterized protein N7483_000463 [Penicillium malachiteum]KAJ5735338.1 hypothetical protein N7483_000463 [Penicillium malachiteum]